MRVKNFQMKIKVFMYKIQGFGWMNAIKLVCDFYDIILWLIQ